MPVLLRRSGDLPEAGAYRTWCVVEGTVPPLPPARRLPDEGGRQERAFDAVADTWLAIARDLGVEHRVAFEKNGFRNFLFAPVDLDLWRDFLFVD